MASQLLLSALTRMRNSNRLGCEFAEIIHAAAHSGVIEAVVRDADGFLWLCREQNPLTLESLSERGALGKDPFLMPVYGPCPDPVEALPYGYSPESTAMLAEAAAIIRRGPARKVAA